MLIKNGHSKIQVLNYFSQWKEIYEKENQVTGLLSNIILKASQKNAFNTWKWMRKPKKSVNNKM